MKGQYEIVVTLTVLLFGLPVLYFIISRKLFDAFSLKQLTKIFNLAFIVHAIIAVIFLISMAYLDKKVYAEGFGNDYTDIIMETAMYYTIILAFIYIPALIILNFVSFLNSKMQSNKSVEIIEDGKNKASS